MRKYSLAEVTVCAFGGLILTSVVVLEIRRKRRLRRWSEGVYAAIEAANDRITDAYMDPNVTQEDYYALWRTETDFLDIITHNHP